MPLRMGGFGGSVRKTTGMGRIMQMVATRGKKEADEKNRSKRFIFLLLDRFTLISFAGAIEPLRITNRMLGRQAYTWLLVGESGKETACSNGASFKLDMPAYTSRSSSDRNRRKCSGSPLCGVAVMRRK